MEGVKDKISGLEASVGVLLQSSERAAAAEAALEASKGGALAAASAARATATAAGQGVARAVRDLRADVGASVGHVEEALAAAKHSMTEEAERAGMLGGRAVVMEQVTPALDALSQELAELKFKVEAVYESEEEEEEEEKRSERRDLLGRESFGSPPPSHNTTTDVSASQQSCDVKGGSNNRGKIRDSSSKPFLHSPSSPRSVTSGRSGGHSQESDAIMARQLASLTAQLASLQGEVVALKALQTGSNNSSRDSSNSSGDSLEESLSVGVGEEGGITNRGLGITRTGFVAFPVGKAGGEGGLPGALGAADLELSQGEVLLVGDSREGDTVRILHTGKISYTV